MSKFVYTVVVFCGVGSQVLLASNIDYVNPLIGTDPVFPNNGNYAGMIPSTGSPFAMTRWTAMTFENTVGKCPYHYTDNMFYGFLATHQPAQWMGESGEVAVSAGMGDVKVKLEERGLYFSHDDEISKPQYYKTKLTTTPAPAEHTEQTPAVVPLKDTTSVEYDIDAEVAATSRSAALRFTYRLQHDDNAHHTTSLKNTAAEPYVVLHATRSGITGEIEINPLTNEIYGRNPERQDDVLGPFTADDFNGYFVARFDTPFKSWGIATAATTTSNQNANINATNSKDTNTDTNKELLYHEGETHGSGEELSAYVRFDATLSSSSSSRSEEEATVVNVHVGVSFISIEQARINLERETPDDSTLEDTAAVVAQQWSDKLDLVELPTASDDELAIFYTAMYHALQYPCEMMEYNDSGVFYYSGFDNAVHAGVAYTGYSIWDTYRAEWAFLNLFAPERINDMIRSMLQTYQQGGRLPIWQNIVETNIMIGTHSSSLIAESLSKGFNDFDLDVMWEAIWKDAMVPPENDLSTIYYDRQPGTGCEARAGLTREKELGYVAAMLTSEAGSRTLEYAYDDFTVAVIAEILGRTSDALFFLERSRNYRNIFNNETQFMEARFEDGTWCASPNTWTEATKWVYTFNVQHDFPGLRDLFMGPEGLAAKLDEYYSGGHNDQTNEPSHATVFAYLYANQPSKAQSTIRQLLSDNYFNDPVGLSGNDDCGQMSSWYIFNALGFYPVNPASAEYMIGSPIFDKAIIRFPQSSSSDGLTITAANARENQYVRDVAVDGRELRLPIIAHRELLQASELNFDLETDPQNWGANVL